MIQHDVYSLSKTIEFISLKNDYKNDELVKEYCEQLKINILKL